MTIKKPHDLGDNKIRRKKKHMKNKYEVVDNIQTFKDYLDGKIKESEIYVVNLENGEIWDMQDLCGADVKNENIVFLRIFRNQSK